LLDGLDEIPTPRQRIFVRDAVITFARRYRQCRLVVTCRTLSYQQLEWQLGDFETCTLAPFTDEQIDAFIAGWHVELARLGSITPGAVDGATRHLQTAVRRPDLWRLASNPLLLMVVTLVHTHKGRLPEARALLYKEAVEILLWRWDQVRVLGDTEPPRLQQLLTPIGPGAELGCQRLAIHPSQDRVEGHRTGRLAEKAQGLGQTCPIVAPPCRHGRITPVPTQQRTTHQGQDRGEWVALPLLAAAIRYLSQDLDARTRLCYHGWRSFRKAFWLV
jgi:hypothetical protein